MLGLGVFALSSCNLDESPTDSITYQDGDAMFATIDDVEKFETGLYQSFRYINYAQMSQSSEVMCDGFNATVDYGNNYGDVHRSDASFTTSCYNTRDPWALCYSAIKNFNIVIEQLPKYATTDADELAYISVVDGEAHFFRAAAYLYLVRHFAKAYGASSTEDLGVPLVLAYNQEEKPARATVAKVYEAIKADLDVAAEKLAGVPGEVGSKVPTIDAVNALYARYYLDVKENSKAAQYAKSVINSAAGYQLASTEDEMTAEYVNDAGKEPIMQLAATLAESGSYSPFDNIENTIVNDIYTMSTKDDANGIYTRPYYLPSQKLIDLYEANDLRLKTWFSDQTKCVLSGTAYTGDFYVFVKYLGNPALTSTGIPNARHAVKPFLLGEMYLIAAEADLKAGNTTNAKNLLNELQTKRGATATEATEVAIENEWFKETVGEGLRMSCFKRWGKGFNGRPGQTGAVAASVLMTGNSYATKAMASDDNHWCWPIPAYDMQVNDNLEQNPGY